MHGHRQIIGASTRPAPNIAARPLANLIQHGGHKPGGKAHKPKHHSEEARDGGHFIGGADAAPAVKDHGGGVEQEGGGGDGKEHDGGPQHGARGPGGLAADAGVACAQVLGQRHGHEGGDDGGERERGGALADLEEADLAFEFLPNARLALIAV
ncbi:MAG: hypothetical protein M1840_006568 [Geoglossum simile]|nr:MAG: hypothetical protein M1840_006568 [Geoglossum simile]